ncbi:hypothetical protein [Lysinibacillus xylanilyticus]|uniref:hypothetical protein n=1 Tax=Lysinibacillus xylanilyticus TaxID=582475 RepID=UPI003CFEF7A7
MNNQLVIDFLVYRLTTGATDYTLVVSKRPDLKEGIDGELIEKKYEYLIKPTQ